jgi:PhnB protein
MITTNTYLHFDGNCREAMTFYGKCMGTDPGFTPYPEQPYRIMHSELHSGPVVLMASDTHPGAAFRHGNNFSISLTCESLAEMERLFDAFRENGQVMMPMHDAFWGGRFGMLTDQFGINWMFSFREPGQH